MFHTEYRPQVGMASGGLASNESLAGILRWPLRSPFAEVGTYVDVRFRESGIDTDRFAGTRISILQVTFDFQARPIS